MSDIERQIWAAAFAAAVVSVAESEGAMEIENGLHCALLAEHALESFRAVVSPDFALIVSPVREGWIKP